LREETKMISKEVQMAVDEIHRERNALAAAAKANELQASQIADLNAKIAALPVGVVLSDEDKKALLDAVNDAGETNAQLADAVPANVDTSASAGATAQGGIVAATPPPDDPTAARPDPIAGTGMSGSVPLMPNSSFDPSGGVNHGVGDAGQPNQAKPIETVGGFVIAGGGSVQRAPGSRADSPSSTLVLPADQRAKGPASSADEAKSGLGDSSQNALLGPDGQPVTDGPGIVQPASPAAQDAAQKQQDALNAEKAARADNPLALSPEDLAKRDGVALAPAGSPNPNPGNFPGGVDSNAPMQPQSASVG
jgi:hypothetical protein